MVSASASGHEESVTTSTRGQSRLSALARELVETVGVEGAIRYCSSLGWQGVLEEVKCLQRQRAFADQSA